RGQRPHLGGVPAREFPAQLRRQLHGRQRRRRSQSRGRRYPPLARSASMAPSPEETTIMKSSLLVASLLALGLHAAPAQAQLSRTFVSAAIGNDANNCDRPTPCRTFQAAHDKTNPDGEVTVLDPGGFGALTITKSIAIINDGVGEAGMLVSGTVGVTVNAGAASYVKLRGITVQGIGGIGGTGIQFNSGFAFTLENCFVRNNFSDGIDFVPNGNGTTNKLVVSN